MSELECVAGTLLILPSPSASHPCRANAGPVHRTHGRQRDGLTRWLCSTPATRLTRRGSSGIQMPWQLRRPGGGAACRGVDRREGSGSRRSHARRGTGVERGEWSMVSAHGGEHCPVMRWVVCGGGWCAWPTRVVSELRAVREQRIATLTFRRLRPPSPVTSGEPSLLKLRSAWRGGVQK